MLKLKACPTNCCNFDPTVEIENAPSVKACAGSANAVNAPADVTPNAQALCQGFVDVLSAVSLASSEVALQP